MVRKNGMHIPRISRMQPDINFFIKIPDPDFHNIPHMYYTVSIMKQSYHIILDGKKTAPLLFRFFTSLPASVHYERKGTPQSRAGPLLKNIILYQYFRNLRLTACHDWMQLPRQKQKLYPFSPKIRQRFPDIIHIGASNW